MTEVFYFIFDVGAFHKTPDELAFGKDPGRSSF